MAKRVKDVEGIHQAHIAAAKKCFTKMFWVVDGDAELSKEGSQNLIIKFPVGFRYCPCLA